ncbi:hypothetical protein IVB24_12000 [Bradyrhizobium sp. 192]|nr:hypothetical protein IVB24_12000 [Bradyrhizobium sp. 192]
MFLTSCVPIVGELDRQSIRHLLVDHTRDRDAAYSREAFQPRGKVDTIAEKITVPFDNVADREADAETLMPAGLVSDVADLRI